MELVGSTIVHERAPADLQSPLRKVLIVSPYFPPSSLAGVHRARHLAKHLPGAGWTPVVVCVDEAHHEERLDQDLATLVPSVTKVIKVGALSPRIARRVGLGDISLRAWRPLRDRVFELLNSQTFDAVLITGSPYYPMLLASAITKKFGVPVVLDFQDPWVSAWGATLSKFSKGGVSHSLATILEPNALRGAQYVTSVSETQNAELAARYPWLDRTRMAAIPIGGDPADFDMLRRMGADESNTDIESGCINISYVGTFLPRSHSLIRAIFRAFARLRSIDAQLTKKIRLNFVGTSNQPNHENAYRILPIAEAEGVAEAVREIPERLPYLRALGVLARSDGLLLIGSDEPHYTASKIYPCLMSGRPYLSLFHRASGSHTVLRSSGGGITLAFETADQLAALEPEIADGLRKLAMEPERLGRADPAAYAPFSAASVARQFAEVFNQVTAKP